MAEGDRALFPFLLSQRDINTPDKIMLQSLSRTRKVKGDICMFPHCAHCTANQQRRSTVQFLLPGDRSPALHTTREPQHSLLSLYFIPFTSVHLSLYPSIYLSISLSISLSVCRPIYQSVCLFDLSIHSSIHQSLFRSTCLFFFYLTTNPLCITVFLWRLPTLTKPFVHVINCK